MFIEIFLIPGTALLSLLGFVIIGIGVYFAYSGYGSSVGNWFLAGSIIGIGLTLYIGYKRMQSKKWALFNYADGKVNNEDVSEYSVGEKGKTISALRPEGKAVFSNDERITVYSMGEFIDVNQEVIIIKIDHNKIFVKQT